MTPEAIVIRIQQEGVTHALIEDFLAAIRDDPYTLYGEMAHEILRGLEHSDWTGCVNSEDFDPDD